MGLVHMGIDSIVSKGVGAQRKIDAIVSYGVAHIVSTFSRFP